MSRIDAKAAIEAYHKRLYEEVTGGSPPAWEELTDAQRAAIRAENDRYAAEMRELGDRIRRDGSILWQPGNGDGD